MTIGARVLVLLPQLLGTIIEPPPVEEGQEPYPEGGIAVDVDVARDEPRRVFHTTIENVEVLGTWVKKYETLDDFVADTGPVVREHLGATQQKLYGRARDRAAHILPAGSLRGSCITLRGTDLSVEIEVKALTIQTVTETVETERGA